MILKRHEGFVLVELMTVLIIIAVLAAISVPIYDLILQTIRNRTDEANARILNSATL
jgi:prepilin-type N-terminal cleavage/methylation domain-containing protein